MSIAQNVLTKISEANKGKAPSVTESKSVIWEAKVRPGVSKAVRFLEAADGGEPVYEIEYVDSESGKTFRLNKIRPDVYLSYIADKEDSSIEIPGATYDEFKTNYDSLVGEVPAPPEELVSQLDIKEE